MDGFSLLRYWRSNGSGHDLTTIANQTAVSTQSSDTQEEENNDHGPFFDLEFTLPEEEEEVKNPETENGVVYAEEEEEEDDDEDDNSTGDVNVAISPSDELFFKGDFIPVDQTTSESQSRVSLMKSATKLRVMMLKFSKKSNSKLAGEIGEDEVKLNEEEVPIVSLFKRHNSSKPQKRQQNDVESVSNDEKKFSKEAMQRYLRKVKPLYIRVSKRYVEKLKFSGQLKQNLATSPSPSSTTEKEKQSPVPAEKESKLGASEAPLLASNATGLKQGNLPAGLRVVCKHLGKSRSSSTAEVAAAPCSISSKRRDDSLLQQQDGIQSAILHCKRSFKASRDSDCSSSEGNDSQKAGN